MKLRPGILISALGIALAALLASDPVTVGAASPGSVIERPASGLERGQMAVPAR